MTARALPRAVSIVALTVVLAPPPVRAERAYHWTDADGVAHFSDSLPEGELDVAVIELAIVASDYDPADDPFSVINQAAQIHERWLQLEQLANERRAARLAAAEQRAAAQRLAASDASAHPQHEDNALYPAWLYPAWPFRPGAGASASAREQARALAELGLLAPQPYSINSGAHQERVARSRALAVVDR